MSAGASRNGMYAGVPTAAVELQNPTDAMVRSARKRNAFQIEIRVRKRGGRDARAIGDEAPADPREDTPQRMPERHLHRFFESLGVPYRAFEADSAAQKAKATPDASSTVSPPTH